jgi:LysR family transcriptional activator of mexEF-oprN operon
MSDDVEFGLLPPLLRALRQEAPNVVFVVQNVDYWRIPDLLASGDITVGISQTRGLPANAKRKLLRHIQPLHPARRRQRYTADASMSIARVRMCWCPISPTSVASPMSGWRRSAARVRWCSRCRNTVHCRRCLPGTDLIASLPDYTAAKPWRHSGLAVQGTVSVQDADSGAVHGLAQPCRQRSRRALVAFTEQF